ncbi:G-type lectin S-receptor-like serine/threonine-protein kinase CES101 [Vitis vinifera]|uniref:G-type lectin S-receptor-like serine/threonine-protein kinase CES101 n=1 Tax=Vitis vinifera TaxID=29760 RepID=A0A438FWV8_VITVI|nr:G-type lectin S-receptor-like serine/threonine-protein kinase CES101 [Vitis vinifera]RVW87259.1 G-type lectin S-receptor-like serine/threonine-protein kinase CES101 [Vitis vinifera]
MWTKEKYAHTLQAISIIRLRQAYIPYRCKPHTGCRWKIDDQEARNSTTTLLDSGNFVLEKFNSDGSMKKELRESFDNLTDTLLPGMKLGINLKIGRNWSFTSWINKQVPALGTFTLEWNGTQLVMKCREGTY